MSSVEPCSTLDAQADASPFPEVDQEKTSFV